MSMTVTSLLLASPVRRVPPRGVLRRDQRAGAIRLPRVENANRNVALDRRQNRARVQHLGAEVGQLGGLGERQLRDQTRRGDHARIGAQHAVHVGPDLNLAGVDAGADERAGIVRSAASERRRVPIRRRADESAKHGDAAAVENRHDGLAQRRVGLRPERRGPRVLGVGDDGAAGIDPVGGHARLGQRRRHDARAEKLAHGRHDVERARRHFAKDSRARGRCRRADRTARRYARAAAPAPDRTRARAPPTHDARAARRHAEAPRSGRPAPAVDAIAQQRVGDLAHRRHDDDRAAAVSRPRGPDDLNQTSDSFWIGDRRAAEFLNDHRVSW